MIRYFIQRPIAVLATFTALIILGLSVTNRIPVSLLPTVDVPQIFIRVNHPNTPSDQLEKTVLSPIRESMANLADLKDIQCRSANHTGVIQLTFEYGTRMNLAYVEVNEKLDALASALPRDMARPQVARLNTSDIPVINIQVIPKVNEDYLSASELTNKILKRRLEQIEGVSLVDINGSANSVINITPNPDALLAIGLNQRDLDESIQKANKNLGGLSVKDGQYRYFVQVQNGLLTEETIRKLPLVQKDGSITALEKVASIELESDVRTGYHLYNGRQSLVITVQKHSRSRMNELVPKVIEAVDIFKKDYPGIDFALTQDQTYLLDAGIDNLRQDLIYAGAFTVLLLFLFLGNWASPALMSITIPVSLIITFIFFYLLDISFNIISLSGLALGIGMVIDTSIVVVDNITRHRKSGLSMEESSVTGTNEVISPVISQVLTTVAVYAPLILLSGMAGALIFDQAIGLTICLGASLLSAFVLTPLLYKSLLKAPPEKLRADTIFYNWLSKGYHDMIRHILRSKKTYFLLTLSIMPLGFWFMSRIPVSALPRIEKKESLITIDWNSPIDAGANLGRVSQLAQLIQPYCMLTEADIGVKQFLFQQYPSDAQQCSLYFSCDEEKTKFFVDKVVATWIKNNYPDAFIDVLDAPNAFTQMFSSRLPYLQARFKFMSKQAGQNSWYKLDDIISKINIPGVAKGPELEKDRSLAIKLDYEKLAIYGIPTSAIENAILQQFGRYTITEVVASGEVTNVKLLSDKSTIDEKLTAIVEGPDGAKYMLQNFVTYSDTSNFKFVMSDRSGEYKSATFPNTVQDVPALERQLRKIANAEGYSVEFTGQYYNNRRELRTLLYVFVMVISLLYFILAVQYENLIQPLIVMATIPLGITGGMFLLWITGGTLDVMAAIGFIVILGLIVDDPILKIETLNRLEQKYLKEGLTRDHKLLERMIHEAGEICLKPLLLVSLTTSIAMVPVLMFGGIGNELQRPLAIVIIGGLTIGTFFTTWFIPLAYWFTNSKKTPRSK